MTGPYREISVRLHRDAFNTPWGFRLQGGKDFNAPLAVQRVFVGSPAEAELQRGDVLLKIENYDCGHMMHKQAMDIIKNSGGSLSITLKRSDSWGPRSGATLPSIRPSSPPKVISADPGAYRSTSLGQQGPVGTLGFIPKPTRPAMSAQPKVQTFGVDYSQYGQKPKQQPRQQFGTSARGPTYPSSMLNRLNASLNDAIWMPGHGPSDAPDAGYDTYQDYREPQHTHHHAPSHASLDEQAAPTLPSETDEMQQYRTPSFGGSSQPSSTPGGGRIWTRPDPYASGGTGMPDPGWTAGMGTQSTNAMARGWAPVKPPQPPLYMERRPVPVPINARRPQPREIRHVEPEEPAWKGSLRSSGAPQTWEVQAAALQIDPEYAAQMAAGGGGDMVQPHQPRVQNIHHKPGHDPVYSQSTPVAQPPAGGEDDDARVVHLQYNSPLQLYSRGNVEETLRGQTGGGQGAGTMQCRYVSEPQPQEAVHYRGGRPVFHHKRPKSAHYGVAEQQYVPVSVRMGRPGQPQSEAKPKFQQVEYESMAEVHVQPVQAAQPAAQQPYVAQQMQYAQPGLQQPAPQQQPIQVQQVAVEVQQVQTHVQPEAEVIQQHAAPMVCVSLEPEPEPEIPVQAEPAQVVEPEPKVAAVAVETAKEECVGEVKTADNVAATSSETEPPKAEPPKDEPKPESVAAEVPKADKPVPEKAEPVKQEPSVASPPKTETPSSVEQKPVSGEAEGKSKTEPTKSVEKPDAAKAEPAEPKVATADTAKTESAKEPVKEQPKEAPKTEPAKEKPTEAKSEEAKAPKEEPSKAKPEQAVETKTETKTADAEKAAEKEQVKPEAEKPKAEAEKEPAKPVEQTKASDEKQKEPAIPDKAPAKTEPDKGKPAPGKSTPGKPAPGKSAPGKPAPGKLGAGKFGPAKPPGKSPTPFGAGMLKSVKKK